MLVRAPVRHQEPRRSDAVQHVDLAPAAIQPLAIGTPVARAAAIVDVAHGKAARCPELRGEAEFRRGAVGRPAVTFDDQRRQLAFRRTKVGVGRPVVEGVSDRTAFRRTDDRLRASQIARIRRQVARGAQLRDVAARRVEQDDRGRAVWPPRTQDRASVLHREAGELGVRQSHAIEPPGADVDGTQVPAAAFAEAGKDHPRIEKSVPAHAERPGGPGKFGRHGADGRSAVVIGAVQIPPTAPVRHEIQAVVGRPGRLHDRLPIATGDLAHLAHAAIGSNFGRP
jgi:hypothetical protein